MDLKIFKTIAYCYRAVSQNYWVNRALETYDKVFLALTDLRMPKDPNKPDIVLLESRILYSASPFFMWSGLDAPSALPDSPWDYPDHMSQYDWDTQLLSTAEFIDDEDLQQRAAAIRLARGMDDPSVSNSGDADSDNSATAGHSAALERSMDERLHRIENLLAGVLDPDDTQMVVHGTDGTQRLGHKWAAYGCDPNSKVETEIFNDFTNFGVRLERDGALHAIGGMVSSDQIQYIPESVAIAAARQAATNEVNDVDVAINSVDDDAIADTLDIDPTIGVSTTDGPELSGASVPWSLESHLNEIDLLNEFHLQLQTRMEGLLGRYTAQPQSVSEANAAYLAPLAISTLDDMDHGLRVVASSQLLSHNSALFQVEAQPGWYVCIAVQPVAEVNAHSSGLPTADLGTQSVTELNSGRNIPSPIVPNSHLENFDWSAPDLHKAASDQGCLAGTLSMTPRRWLRTGLPEAYCTVVHLDHGQTNLTPESLAILESSAEQLSSTVPALQTPTPDDVTPSESPEARVTTAVAPDAGVSLSADIRLSADAAPEQLGQLFYNEIAFVQAGLYDSDALIADLEANALATGRDLTIIVLNGTENGFDQINSALAQYQNLDAIHIVSHGTDGMIQLGASWLTAGNVQQHFGDLQQWGLALNETGDILVYGCDVAAGPEGQALIDTVARLTGADVAASTDKTGNASRGGDWSLEYVAANPSPPAPLPLSGARGDELSLLPSPLGGEGLGVKG